MSRRFSSICHGAWKFSNTTIVIYFNLLQICLSMPSIVFVVFFLSNSNILNSYFYILIPFKAVPTVRVLIESPWDSSLKKVNNLDFSITIMYGNQLSAYLAYTSWRHSSTLVIFFSLQLLQILCTWYARSPSPHATFALTYIDCGIIQDASGLLCHIRFFFWFFLNVFWRGNYGRKTTKQPFFIERKSKTDLNGLPMWFLWLRSI